MAGAMHTGNFADVIAPGFDVILFNEYKKNPQEWPRFFNVETMGDGQGGYIDKSYVTGLGSFVKKQEGENVAWTQALQGFDIRFTPVTYALAFRLTEELQEDDRANIFGQRMSQALGESGAESENVLIADVVNSGTDATVRTGGDGVCLFSASHLYADGSTWSNILAAASDVSVSAIWQMILDMETMKDDQGKYMTREMKPKHIFFAPANDRAMGEIFTSEKIPYSMNNETNVLRSRGIGREKWTYMTDTDAWGIQAAKHTMLVVWRKKLETKPSDDFNTGDSMYKARFRIAFGWVKPFGVHFTPGA